MTRRPLSSLACIAAVLAASACAGTNAVSQSVSGSLGYGAGDQATTWITPAHRSRVTAVTGHLLDGSPFDLDQWRGHVVVVNFWGSWCGPCTGEARSLQQVYRDDASKGVEFLGVDIRENAAQAESFLRTHHITYPNLSDESNLIALHFQGMPPNATPTTIVLDRQGRIAARHSGAILYTDLRDLVARVVRERSP
ncbi:MAG TPA: TlpA disulfide reductase family protein [Mycobacteriales bacterium]|nr:TlpA disulfide reductase family protein [Mycobacteriales bacterium]